MTMKDDYWTEERLQLKAWFERNAPSLGELYEGSLRMMFDTTFPGRSTLISHAVREIRNRLPDVVSGERGKPTFQYKNRLNKLLKQWRMNGFLLDDSLPESFTSQGSNLTNNIPIPRCLFIEISTMLKDYDDIKGSKKEAAMRLYRSLSPDEVNSRKFLDQVVNMWLNITSRFEGKAHDSLTPDNKVGSSRKSVGGFRHGHLTQAM